MKKLIKHDIFNKEYVSTGIITDLLNRHRNRVDGNKVQSDEPIDILADTEVVQEVARQRNCTPREAASRVIQDGSDIFIAREMAMRGKTIFIDTTFALSLKSSLDKFEKAFDQPLYFPQGMIFQFSRPIPEHELFFLERDYPVENDKISAILYGDHMGLRNVVAFFTSLETQRVQWKPGDPDFAEYILPEMRKPSDAEMMMANKRCAQLMAVAINAYLNCSNIVIEEKAPSGRVMDAYYHKLSKRKAKKKPPTMPEPYYIAYISKAKKSPVKARTGGQGGRHGFRYDVGHHIRTLADGRTIFIPDHERGLDHPPETKPEKVYRITEENFEETKRFGDADRITL